MGTPKSIDAGLRQLDHYKNRLPTWRYVLRQRLIPIVRWETPLLADFQDKYRTPTLDAYFASTANLGTHTFFMIILPILFWCGYVRMGRAMVHMLSSGVFFSGWLKDLFCLPRPLSPPLQRISKSASAALEYGFPSTHSTNAVSVALYAIYEISTTPSLNTGPIYYLLIALFTFYATSIVIGRLYCGMHGYFDVVVGTILGALIAAAQILIGDAFDQWVIFGPAWNLALVTLIVLVLVRTHPEPADDCPCYDDSVAFAGVFIGAEFASWHMLFFSWSLASTDILPGAPFSYAQLGLLKAAVRIVLGVLVVFAWRGTMKPALLNGLPPILRLIESAGLDQPRRFFLRASEYKHVPPLRRDDNVIPPISEIPAMIGSLRHPRRRAISIGPQSQADAYEAIAFRERKRRESQSSMDGSGRPVLGPRSSTTSVLGGNGALNPALGASSGSSTGNGSGKNEAHIERVAQDVISEGSKEANAAASTASAVQAASDAHAATKAKGEEEAQDARDDKAMFLQLQKPRVRYDVEVVTKLIVYSGIAWWSVEGMPIIFQAIGLAPL